MEEITLLSSAAAPPSPTVARAYPTEAPKGGLRARVRAWWRGGVDGLRETFGDLQALWRPLPGLSGCVGASDALCQVAHQQFRQLIHQLPRNVLAAAVGAGLWVVAAWFVAPGPRVAVWAAAAGVAILAMVSLLRQFAQAHPADDALRPWEVRFGRLHTLMGFTWGCTVFLAPGETHTLYTALGLILVLFGSLSLYVVYRPSLSWLALPSMVPVVPVLLFEGGLNAIIGAGLFVVVVLLMRLARVHNALMTQALLESAQRAVLLAELETQRLSAEAANQAKTRFLAMVSHDLRQPLHSIALLSVALGRKAQDGEAVEALGGQISASVQAMDSLLGALLEVSRLDHGTLPLQVTTVPLAGLLDDTALQFAAQASERGLVLQVHADTAAHVVSDNYQLRRLLANLVANAIRYTSRGGVVVRCRVRGSVAWLQVWDSGQGIARADRQRIFEEFVRLPQQHNPGPQPQGLGLGLSIVRKVAQRLNHPVVVRSRLGRGSLFGIGLPLHVRPRTQPSDAATLPALLGEQLILLIEDDAVALQGMRTLLATCCRCPVLVAPSLAGAVEAVERSLRVPDLVISDFRLQPGVTGLDAIARIREVTGEAVPALLLTADPAAARPAAMALGVSVLAKPLQLPALVDALRGLARARPVATDLDPAGIMSGCLRTGPPTEAV